MFSILNQMDEKNNIVRHRKDKANDIVLGDSKFKDFGNDLSNIRNFRTRKISVMCYPEDFIKDRLVVVHESRRVIKHVGGNSIRNRVKEIGKIVV